MKEARDVEKVANMLSGQSNTLNIVDEMIDPSENELKYEPIFDEIDIPSDIFDLDVENSTMKQETDARYKLEQTMKDRSAYKC